jgi:hypothetical protein
MDNARTIVTPTGGRCARSYCPLSFGPGHAHAGTEAVGKQQTRLFKEVAAGSRRERGGKSSIVAVSYRAAVEWEYRMRKEICPDGRL